MRQSRKARAWIESLAILWILHQSSVGAMGAEEGELESPMQQTIVLRAAPRPTNRQQEELHSIANEATGVSFRRIRKEGDRPEGGDGFAVTYDLIAWAAKYYDRYPPYVAEEMIMTTRITKDQKTVQCVLLYAATATCQTVPWSARFSGKDWCRGLHTTMHCVAYDSDVTSEQICAFVSGSAFGYNEPFPEREQLPVAYNMVIPATSVLKVICFRDDEDLVRVLSRKADAKTRSKLRETFLRSLPRVSCQLHSAVDPIEEGERNGENRIPKPTYPVQPRPKR